MKFTKDIVLLSNNDLIIKIMGRTIEKAGYGFSSYKNFDDINLNNFTMIIVDFLSISGMGLKSYIENLYSKFSFKHLSLFNSNEKNEKIKFYIEDDFGNLNQILEEMKLDLENNLEDDEDKHKKIESPEKKMAQKDKTNKNSQMTLRDESSPPVISDDFNDKKIETHILLADDSKPVRNFVKKILTGKGFLVDTFVNGQELIDYLSNGNKGDIILLDNQMPVMGGIEALQILKGTEQWKDIPALFLSALTGKDQVVQALELGADDYMEKPFNNNEFLARINVHVRIDHLKKNLIVEKEKADKLLLNTLPKKIVDDLKIFGKTDPETFENVTVYFSDIVSFTNHSSRTKPDDLIAELNIIFTEFDEIMERHHCERIKTIGDAYLAVCGMPEPEINHAENMIKASIEIVNYMKKRFKEREDGWEMRIGIHSGSVVGGIVGEKKYIYDVFGDTINTSSRMESNSEPMRINVSDTTHELVKDKFNFTQREEMEVKGKGPMTMYFVETE